MLTVLAEDNQGNAKIRQMKTGQNIRRLALVSCALGVALEATALTQLNLKWEQSEYAALTNT